MRRLATAILGLPLGEREIRAQVKAFVRLRDVHAVRAVMSENLAHITSKSGALLQAQGLFVVVAAFLLTRGWTRTLALAAIVLLMLSALAVLTNLRTVLISPPARQGGDKDTEIEIVVQTARLASRRGAVFNVALYLTFLSLVILGLAALSLVP
jgi:Mlc titration factor MtfA (ptsG expression regulator)